MPFIPHTKNDVASMLETIGVDSIDQLFDEIPEHLAKGQLDIMPAGRSEMEVMRLMSERAEQDAGLACFAGAGAYEHHIPSAIWDIAARGEFMTAYTPYQAEASQGTLQVIYEYQSMMAHLTAMDVSNASMYDGASAMAEAVLMSIRANRKSKTKKLLVPRNINPSYRNTSHAIVHNQNIELVDVDYEKDTGLIDMASLQAYEGQDFAALVISQPNFFGNVEDVNRLTDWAHANNILVIALVNPTSLALLSPPGEWGETGADICVGEGQPLGVPMSSGGPYFGFMCCKQAYVRQMPGRIIGRTVDLDGKTGFALTLQAREQHIRRSKATSNICTNQGWAVTAATIYLSLLGASGLQQVAQNSHQNLMRLRAGLEKMAGVDILFSNSNFHELVFSTSLDADELIEAMANKSILAGVSLKNDYPELQNAILVCTTETKTESDIEDYLNNLTEVLGGQV